MTDLSHQPMIAAPASSGPFMSWPLLPHITRPLLPHVCVIAAGGAGLLLGRAVGSDADAFESQLILLLRFMAAMKFAGVLAAAALTGWRLTAPIDGRLAVAYLAALVTMAGGPGLIWSLGGIAFGALLFHVGLLTFLVLAWKNDGASLPSRR